MVATRARSRRRVADGEAGWLDQRAEAFRSSSRISCCASMLPPMTSSGTRPAPLVQDPTTDAHPLQTGRALDDGLVLFDPAPVGRTALRFHSGWRSPADGGFDLLPIYTELGEVKVGRGQREVTITLAVPR